LVLLRLCLNTVWSQLDCMYISRVTLIDCTCHIMMQRILGL
jgi:hypothetical protein